jgi:hypothetical protein
MRASRIHVISLVPTDNSTIGLSDYASRNDAAAFERLKSYVLDPDGSHNNRDHENHPLAPMAHGKHATVSSTHRPQAQPAPSGSSGAYSGRYCLVLSEISTNTSRSPIDFQGQSFLHHSRPRHPGPRTQRYSGHFPQFRPDLARDVANQLP